MPLLIFSTLSSIFTLALLFTLVDAAKKKRPYYRAAVFCAGAFLLFNAVLGYNYVRADLRATNCAHVRHTVHGDLSVTTTCVPRR